MNAKSCADLCTLILGTLKSEDSARVALYHYLKNFKAADTEVTPSLINEFYGEALQLNHWRDRKADLHDDIQDLLRTMAQTAPFRLDLVWDLARTQIVAIEQADTLSQIVNDFEIAGQKDGERLRIIQEGTSEGSARAVAVRRKTDGSFVVRTYANVTRVDGSRLVPVGTEQEIFYDAGLEFQAGAVQKIRPLPNSQIRFVAGAEGVKAQIVTGFAFRQTQTISMKDVREEPRIFYPLKRLERLYVHRPSDPFYAEIISSLDHALRLVRSGAPEAQTQALRAFDSGQIAFDQIFPDDRAIYTRLRELARWIATTRRTSSQRGSLEVREFNPTP